MSRVVLDHLSEQRRSRRWGVFFKLATFAYLTVLLVLLWPRDLEMLEAAGEEHTALIEVNGLIAPETSASAERINAALRQAFENENTKAVVLKINSPGGSPVQSAYINDEIRRLRKKYPDIPVYAVAADICASGGYWVAVAADEIYVSKASLVGSIGVRMDGFGFVETLEDLGVERRLLTAGSNKGILDPFSPMGEEERSYIQGVLDELHRQFIGVVKAGRGKRLKGGDELFSGLFWTGEESLALGLADGIGDADYVARELVGVDNTVEFSAKKDLFEDLMDRLGASAAHALVWLSGAGAYPVAR